MTAQEQRMPIFALSQIHITHIYSENTYRVTHKGYDNKDDIKLLI